MPANGNINGIVIPEVDRWNKDLLDGCKSDANRKFRGDASLAENIQVIKAATTGDLVEEGGGLFLKNPITGLKLLGSAISGGSIDFKKGMGLIAQLKDDSPARQTVIQAQVKSKYNKMLHPPLTYLGNAFQYRQSDGKFNSVLHPHLGQGGAPYAKTVPSKSRPLGALPDPGDLFDRLMARSGHEKLSEGDDPVLGRESGSGLSAMLVYHATIIIHDIFRSNASDKNISDTSSYLDLSPLYGYTDEMTRAVRDTEYKLGLLKPDTFAEDRLIRQPPGVCVMLVMYNRFHNYVATQLRRINENGRFSLPQQYYGPKPVSVIKQFLMDPVLSATVPKSHKMGEIYAYALQYEKAVNDYRKRGTAMPPGFTEADIAAKIEELTEEFATQSHQPREYFTEKAKAFDSAYDAAWNKLDDDLFGTARLITCGLYVNISIHDYLRALMGFHAYDTTFTLDPRIDIPEVGQGKEGVSRGIGNQVTTEFNLLYRFHCAISRKDEIWVENMITWEYGRFITMPDGLPAATLDESAPNGLRIHPDWDPKTMTMPQFMQGVGGKAMEEELEKRKREQEGKSPDLPPEEKSFIGLDPFKGYLKRDPDTGLFDDTELLEILKTSMQDKLCNFGARNIPNSMKQIEILGILQARKWEIGTLNDFREFFELERHKTFESITPDKIMQEALEDLYEHPDKVELYPGIFCEANVGGATTKDLDPGPLATDSALWSAIFSDAITLVRSDRFYTIDWNTNSLTSWGMKECTPEFDIMKSSVFHRLLQRAFPQCYDFDSIYFFHPFFTPDANMALAKAQGYTGDIGDFTASSVNTYQLRQPQLPTEPIYINTYKEASAILTSPELLNPACLSDLAFPPEIKKVLDSNSKKDLANKGNLPKPPALQPEDKDVIAKYFEDVTRELLRRESLYIPRGYTSAAQKASGDANECLYQVDIARDVAIPLVTRFFANFLGFTHLILTNDNPNGKYRENDIYEHIINCQNFLAYNVDETKLLSRRKKFKSSMTFLFNLAKEGNVKAASKSWFSNLNPANWFGGGKGVLSMVEVEMGKFGMRIATEILKQENWNLNNAAAQMLMIAIDAAYNAVLMSMSILDFFLIRSQDPKFGGKSGADSHLFKLQEAAFSNDIALIRRYILEAERLWLRLPIIRKVAQKPADSAISFLNVDDTVVIDIVAASKGMPFFEGNPHQPHEFYGDDKDTIPENQYLDYASGFSQGCPVVNVREIHLIGLTSMAKVIAQMKNLRTAHDSQGSLKKVSVNQAYDTYENYMSPMRVEDIRRKKDKKLLNTIDTSADEEHVKRAEKARAYLARRTKAPANVTFMSPEWDEFIPFPRTWKVRFEGYGKGVYDGADRSSAHNVTDLLWAPDGPSYHGGTFGDLECICRQAGHSCSCAKHEALSIGSGFKAKVPSKGINTGPSCAGCGM